ncbi:hypothetical protein L4D16_00055 [Vibrio alginolyticus]|uniref:hypothetical protein n=1 Tax=Vibrio alginolyticus TaxID=663 RepID=UPI0021D3EB2C
MNLDYVNSEPYRGYHQFHEKMNTTIKIMTASLHHTMNHVNEIGDDKELGRMIAASDKAWINPPIWSFEGLSESEVYNFVSELGIVSAFSALDDFFDGVEAEIERWNKKLPERERTLPLKKYDKAEEKVENIYVKYDWSVKLIEKYLPVLKYFRLARNCIAHRNSKVSPALACYSSSDELKQHFEKIFKNKTITCLPEFEENQKVVFDPKLSIFCSHILREIAKAVNAILLSILGVRGIFNMAIYHGFIRDKPVKTDAYRTPEAVLNFILTDRYKLILSNDLEAVAQAKKQGLWKICIEEFDKKRQVERA